MRKLATDEISKSYKGRQVVHAVSVQVTEGEVVGLLGPNGAGKTTSFYMIVGLIQPDGGRILLDDEDITRHADVSAGAAVRDQLSAAGAVGVPQADGGGEHPGGAGSAAHCAGRCAGRGRKS